MEIFEEEVKEFRLAYEDRQGDGFSFPCDKQGSILWEKCSSPEATKKSLDFCKSHPERWTGKSGEVVALIRRSRYGICPQCGRRVYLGGSGWAAYLGTAECECGQWYNAFGQALRPPEEWDDLDEPLDEPLEEIY